MTVSAFRNRHHPKSPVKRYFGSKLYHLRLGTEFDKQFVRRVVVTTAADGQTMIVLMISIAKKRCAFIPLGLVVTVRRAATVAAAWTSVDGFEHRQVDRRQHRRKIGWYGKQHDDSGGGFLVSVFWRMNMLK